MLLESHSNVVRQCDARATSFVLYHQQNLQIHGISVPGMNDCSGSNGRRMFREFRLQFTNHDSLFDSVSLKLPIVPAGESSYQFIEDRVLFNNSLLEFPDAIARRVPIPQTESTWHLKGYTFPYRGS